MSVHVTRYDVSRPTFDWNHLEEATEDKDDLVKVTTTNERIVGSICRGTLNGPIVHWKARRRAQLIPRAKLRAPLPNYQRLQLSFSSEKPEDDHESNKLANKVEKRGSRKVVSPIFQMEPQMIRVKDTVSPASHLHSEKIRISRDAAIFEIKRELPYDGAKFSSRYEIYNSTTKPFGKSYRELTVSSSASGISSCESHTSSVSSSGLSETTTYITCSSEIEPVQMTGFQCIDETTERHSVCILNEENYDDIHEATNYNIPRLRLPAKTESDDNDSEKEIVADTKRFSSFYTTHSTAASAGDESDRSIASPSPRKHIVNIETWSNGTRDEPLKSPTLLKQMISNFEDPDQQQLYKIPKLSTNTTYEEDEYVYEPKLNTSSSQTVTRCRSLLNLELQPDAGSPEADTPPPISKATSELALQDEVSRRQQEKERITKTISVMLENRRQQTAQQRATSAGIADGPAAANTFNGFANNEKLVNENVVLVEPRQTHTLDRGSCRVTGELLKSKAPSVSGGTYLDYHRNACTLPRTMKSHRTQLQRHFYYPLHAVKSSSRVPDEELPDPDKVKHARELFERVLKIGSLENVNGSGGGQRSRSPKKENWSRPTPEVRQPHDTPVVHSKLHKCFSVDASQTNHHQTFKWTDNGSMSSGVGSDISVETDVDLHHKDGMSGSDSGGSKEDALFTSDEDLSSGHGDAAEELGKPITPDVLNGIRAYGTSVTYYGGKIIASSKGYACSPMTMTIMNEIRRSSPDYHANRKFLFDDKQLAKFRLVKSNSCGSRLELSATEEYGREYERKLQALKEDCNNNELVARATGTIAEEEEEEPGKRAEHQRLTTRQSIELFQGKQTPQRDVKQWVKNGATPPPANGKAYCDMEFEEFEVLEDKS